MLRVETAKESENREKFPDPRTSTDNIITGTQALSRLAAMPNFAAIQGDQQEMVCELLIHYKQHIQQLQTLQEPWPL